MTDYCGRKVRPEHAVAITYRPLVGPPSPVLGGGVGGGGGRSPLPCSWGRGNSRSEGGRTPGWGWGRLPFRRSKPSYCSPIWLTRDKGETKREEQGWAEREDLRVTGLAGCLRAADSTRRRSAYIEERIAGYDPLHRGHARSRLNRQPCAGAARDARTGGVSPQGEVTNRCPTLKRAPGRRLVHIRSDFLKLIVVFRMPERKRPSARRRPAC
jgi:hypothetical protein